MTQEKTRGKWKVALKRIAGVLFAVILLAACLILLTRVLERKDSRNKYKQFFEEKQDYDVLYFGSSHALDAFYPMELWREFGITSYNFGGYGNYIPTTYWVMQNALDYTTPKVALIDVFFITRNYKTYYENASFVHYSLDAFPLSLTKIRSALDLTDDKRLYQDAKDGTIDIANEAEKRDPIAFLWDFSVYHNRWAELGEEDFDLVPWRTKGAETNTNVADPDEEYYVPLPEKFEEETVAKEYLRKMIEDCQKRGIEVVLTYLPHLADDWDWRAANSVYDIAEEYGIDYLDFLYMDVVDYQTDMSDPYAHLNASGAKKVTRYLGEYLQEKFGLENRKQDPAYAGWLEDEEDYLNYKAEKFPKCENLRDNLMLLIDKDFDAVLDVRSIRFWEDERYLALLNNLGLDEEDKARLSKKTQLIVIRGGEDVTVVNQKDIADDAIAETVLGNIRLSDRDGEYQIYLNDEAVIARNSEDITGKQVDVCVMENRNPGTVVDNVLYTMKTSKTDGKTEVSTKKYQRQEAKE